jgi:nitrogen regulatory protein P-II 1
MKRIEAIIRPEKLEVLRASLEKVSAGMTVTEVEGHGKQKGVKQQWRGRQFQTNFLPKVKVELVVPDKAAKALLEKIVEVCQTGNVGDGKIFISTVEDALRIRTGEKGDKALN